MADPHPSTSEAAVPPTTGSGWHRVRTTYAAIGILALNALVILGVVELGARIVTRFSRLCEDSQPASAPRAIRPESLSFYRNWGLGSPFWTEHRQAEALSRYAPYVLWKATAHRGRYVNISEDHVRQTPGSDCTPHAYRVFLLGGSAAWGFGSPDSGTIAFHLQAELNRRRTGPACVVNLAQNAWVSTQEVIELMNHLGRGDVPDAVVFYDGFNDAYAAFETRSPGAHYSLKTITDRFERPEADLRRSVRALVKATASYQSARCLVRRLSLPPPTPASPGPEGPPPQLAADAAAHYVANVRMVEGLARSYGFDVAFFWQPTLFTGRKPRSGEERRLRWHQPASVPLIASIDEGVRVAATNARGTRGTAGLAALHYLGSLFDGDTSLRFIDYVHVTPHANLLVARSIADSLWPTTGGRHPLRWAASSR